MTARAFHELLRQQAHVFITTINGDGSPQTTMTWVDTDGDHALVNIPAGTLKARNVARDPRVSLAVASPHNPRHYFAARGTVVATHHDPDMSHFDRLTRKYLGTPFAELGGPIHDRIILTIAIDGIHEAK